MNDGFAWWLILLGIAIGVGLVWVSVIRLPRTELDVEPSETPIEADWISRNIETYGGIAPQALVEEVLELHRQYLVTGATPLPPAWRPGTDEDGPGPGQTSEAPFVTAAQDDGTADPSADLGAGSIMLPAAAVHEPAAPAADGVDDPQGA